MYARQESRYAPRIARASAATLAPNVKFSDMKVSRAADGGGYVPLLGVREDVMERPGEAGRGRHVGLSLVGAGRSRHATFPDSSRYAHL